jgi:hypothetical protein
MESDGGIYLRDTSSAANLWACLNDGRTFAKSGVWHSDIEGVARLLYNSAGATNFNGDYNFISHSREHGMYSDGTIRWGQNQGVNARGTLTWDTNKAIVSAPHTLELTGALGGVTANAFTVSGNVLFNTSSGGLTYSATSSTTDLTISDLSTNQMRAHHNTTSGNTRIYVNIGGVIKSVTLT